MILTTEITLTPEMEKQLEASGWTKPKPALATIEAMKAAFLKWYSESYDDGHFSSYQRGSITSWNAIERQIQRFVQ